MAEHFPDYVPSSRSQGATTSYSVLRARFGDGYEQVSPLGVNPVTKSWSVSFNGLTQAQADEIMDFLDARAGRPFLWTPPWGGGESLWVTEGQPRVRPNGPVLRNVQAVFREFRGVGL